MDILSAFSMLLGSSTLVLVLVGIGYLYFKRRAKGLFGDELQPLGDPTRYALAGAVLEGSSFRRRVMDIAHHPFRARAPEIGLDFSLLLAACERWERQDRVLNLSIVLLLLYLLFGYRVLQSSIYLMFGFSEATFRIAGVLGVLQTGVLIAVVILVIIKALRDERRLNGLRRDTYDPSKLRNEFGAEKFMEMAPGAQDNVVCYGTREPFQGLGVRSGGWQVAVELDRVASNPLASALSNGDGHGTITPVNTGELLTSVDQAVGALDMSNMELRFPLFVSGTEVAQLGQPFMVDRFSRPAAGVDAQTLGNFWFQSDPRARSYRCYRITDWNGELVFSYLLRFVQRGRSLAIETSQLVLAPVDPRYRRIDAMRHRGFLGSILWFLSVVTRSPLTIWSAFVSTIYHVGELLGLAGTSQSSERREVERNPAYNYGARQTIREHVASRNFNAHFQFIDGRQYFKAIDQRVLNAIVDSLAASGVDVSSLVDQAQTVINGSVNMSDNSVSISGNSGSINTGNISGAGAAIGAGAQAAMKQAAGGRQ